MSVMEWFTVILLVQVFLRFLLAGVLLSSGMGKLLHWKDFWLGLRNYQVIPVWLEKGVPVSLIGAWGIPILEIGAGLGLLSGFALYLVVGVTLCFWLIFTGAMVVNLLRKRYDLLCHCSGLMGNHHLSWWLVLRNAALIGCASVLFVTPPDLFSVTMAFSEPGVFQSLVWNIVLPAGLLVGVVFFIWMLLSYVFRA
jgi:hypothetical protein